MRLISVVAGLSSNINSIAGDLTISAGNAASTLRLTIKPAAAPLTLTNATLTGTGTWPDHILHRLRNTDD